MKKSQGLRWRIVTILLAVSLLPLGLVGIGAWVVFGGLLEEKTLQMHRRVVQTHAQSIDLYLAERLRALDLVARTNRLADLQNERSLELLLVNLNDSYGMSFVDLGIISETGAHLAYVGPYELRDKNYANERWFKDVMVSGIYLSDVFLGFRQVPHCVIAVRRQGESGKWLLRATINSDVFDRLVQTGQLGKTGDAFIVNVAGVFQTPPRSGRVLEQSSIAMPQMHPGVMDSRVVEGSTTLLRTTTWINDGRWMLVVQQDEAEIQAPVRRALILGVLVVMVAVALVVVTTFLATWHLTSRIDRANAQRDALSRDLIRSAKLASLGEMATGLAHEINNPLAIIGAEQTNIGDLVGDLAADTPGREEILQSAKRCKRQVQRCGGITAKMLQFGRKSEVRLEPTDVAPRLEEIVHLMRKQAEVRNVELGLDVEPDLPRVMLDPTELEQVMVNLVNNSLYATRGGGRVLVSALRNGHEVLIKVADDGCGIAREDLERIFQPFFTTKPPGKGTGLGLSVCYGIVRTWGGGMEADSRPGRGTAITVRLPIPSRNTQEHEK
jgi:two-component system NtrC family sensor kinase